MALLLAPALAASAFAAEPGAAAATPASRADAEWILARLARPAPMRTGFVELRGSALLKAPLRLTGEYRRPDRDTLVREVRAPYAETTTLRDGDVRIDRDGRRAWTMALTPREAAVAARLRGITLYGRGAELRCIETRPVQGDVQRTLLAGAARAAATVADAAALAALCTGTDADTP